MKLTIIGTGYVGLVTGACFSEMGNYVTCVDIDREKIDNLKKGILPIYEPGLESIVLNNCKEGFLEFTTSLNRAAKGCHVFFIAVGTPPGEDGSADLTYVLEVAQQIGSVIEDYSVIVDKSTVPVGTADKVNAQVRKTLEVRGTAIEFDVVSNPEFLKEGAAVNDFLKPDRIIIGTDSNRARNLMRRLYAPFSKNRDKILFMNTKDAEMTKYAANAMLATKISFMNEISILCERLGVDVESVRKGIGSDPRIGYSFIYPGCGYGGSCFPKDVKALVKIGRDVGFTPRLLETVEERNTLQKQVLGDKVLHRFGQDLTGRTFTVWGLAFKPGTDDMREASSRVLITTLVNAGARVNVYDPVAMKQARKEIPAQEQEKIHFAQDPYLALDNADACLLLTEWKIFRQPDFKKMASLMKHWIIFDGRNQYDPDELKEAGFEYHGIGRELVC